ncbi:helix-turn-helix transcriptional regulator [Kiloniella laminariae]|uniref:helix-turn-helix transcriptional regulator n=1 Tax=Kiloniella laminariae TaxID=454162 RepID=UPI001B7F8BAB|nr:YafY family protein [Kiloniella laminariae]
MLNSILIFSRIKHWPNHAMRLLRLFSILDRLRARRHPVAAETLAMDLGVSLRTIYRDMATLQEMGAPIRGEAGIGYQIEKGYFLPPLHFDPDELDALIIGTELAAARGDQHLGEAAKRARAKMIAVLPDHIRDKHRDLPLYAYSTLGKSDEDKLTFLSPLRNALRQHDKLMISYLDLKDQPSQRTVRPLALTVFDRAWLLTSWCEKANDFRNFRVDRIQSLTTTGETFRPEPGKLYSDYVKTFRHDK